MPMVRTPLRLPEDISALLAEVRGDVGLNTWIVRAVAERLVKEGHLTQEEAEQHIGTSYGNRRRPRTTGAWGRK